jgi:hypothetical protein
MSDFPALPTGSSRNKIEFLYDLLSQLGNGATPPDLSASVTYNSNYYYSQSFPRVYRLCGNYGFPTGHNQELYQNDNDGVFFNLYEPFKALKQFESSNWWNSMGFDITLHIAKQVTLSGDALTAVQECVDSSGHVLVHYNMTVNGQDPSKPTVAVIPAVLDGASLSVVGCAHFNHFVERELYSKNALFAFDLELRVEVYGKGKFVDLGSVDGAKLYQNDIDVNVGNVWVTRKFDMPE